MDASKEHILAWFGLGGLATVSFLSLNFDKKEKEKATGAYVLKCNNFINFEALFKLVFPSIFVF